MRPNTFPVLTAEELALSGRVLFGVHWRAEMARALGLADESLIRAVEAGREPAPDEWRARLIAMAQDLALNAMETASRLLQVEEAGQSPQPAQAEAAKRRIA
jgi:hypothetical protein